MKLVHLEELSDKLEYEIAGFLSNVSTGNLTEEEAEQVKVLYRVIGELESLGDSGENISRILERERVHNRKFDDDSISKILTLSSKVEKGYDVMVENLKTLRLWKESKTFPMPMHQKMTSTKLATS